MYTLIGGDGKEYGPVSAVQVRAWLADGRANGASRIRPEGTEAWTTIAEIPELTAPAAAPEIIRTGQLDILSCYERSWNLLKRHFWPLVGISAVMLLIFAGILVLERVLLYGYLVALLVTGAVNGGWQYFFLGKLRNDAGRPSGAGGTFGAALGALIVAGMLVSMFVCAGIFLLLIPGIYLIVAYSFTYLLAVDKGLSAWNAMETSRRTITRQWWPMLGLILLGILINLAGALALGVGILVTVPITLGALVYAYEDLCAPKA